VLHQFIFPIGILTLAVVTAKNNSINNAAQSAPGITVRFCGRHWLATPRLESERLLGDCYDATQQAILWIGADPLDNRNLFIG
jgi:hypothetical protein